ncbi:MAG: hypothetical protein HXL29_01380, partial [Prevotellaceae bacterium]|nr:hypothetical protein [Prevotellaceae bacterium]
IAAFLHLFSPSTQIPNDFGAYTLHYIPTIDARRLPKQPGRPILALTHPIPDTSPRHLRQCGGDSPIRKAFGGGTLRQKLISASKGQHGTETEKRKSEGGTKKWE